MDWVEKHEMRYLVGLDTPEKRSIETKAARTGWKLKR